ncbi:MAG: phosphate signaling complex protein PhoU [Methanobrevibacter sp.]|jgi:phosphate transport system protein|nr:phosphate signaling complex protein PhoU [Methanobrevibacter sp.]
MVRKYPNNAFKKRIEEIEENIENLGHIIIESYRTSILLLTDFDDDLIKKVIEQSNEIDEIVFELEKKCIQFIAVEQPVAGDLMFVETIIKISSSLNRIGYLSAKIAKFSRTIKDIKIPEKLVNDCQYMGDYVYMMLSKSINAFLNKNIITASELKDEDDRVDELFDSILIQVTELMSNNADSISSIMTLIFIARYLERIGDRAVNIGSRTIFMLTFKRTNDLV